MYIHTYIHTYMQTYTHTFIHPYINAAMRYQCWPPSSYSTPVTTPSLPC